MSAAEAGASLSRACCTPARPQLKRNRHTAVSSTPHATDTCVHKRRRARKQSHELVKKVTESFGVNFVNNLGVLKMREWKMQER